MYTTLDPLVVRYQGELHFLSSILTLKFTHAKLPPLTKSLKSAGRNVANRPVHG